MKVLIVGTGGVGESMAAIAKRRDPNKGWLEKMVMADYDLAKAQAISKRLGEDRFPAEKVDASNPD
ncbi:MAG TPA: saccharopine dehydrogenase NADP-binding domain-containing protein, partial [Thermoleophilia bacterium]|nr:saccharopine dehydrogenase NADP-binding domain-containing protein [Thermoleophilia bacterium]